MASSSSGAAAAAAVKKAIFTPRQTYDASTSITRSYFLGHHHAAVNRMRQILQNIGLIIECRDFRVPLTSWNPILESTLEARHRARIIVYTKRDLGPGRGSGGKGGGDTELVSRLTEFHREEWRTRYPAAAATTEGDDIPPALFLGEGEGSKAGDRALLSAIRHVARAQDSMVGLRALVVGMPNAGKSTLLNRLRASGVGKTTKAAATGAQPGVTRRLGTPVRIVGGSVGGGGQDGAGGGDVVPGEGVFLMDTPGVFVPYVGSPEAMVKLALVGCVKDGLVPAVTVADYLLFRLNLLDPSVYGWLCPEPTNDVHAFLEAAARRTGKLGKGGVPSIGAAAEWVVQLWRKGQLGRFVLDEVSDESLRTARADALNPAISMNQAREREKLRKKEKSATKRTAVAAATGARVGSGA